jgi:hypothetical protein
LRTQAQNRSESLIFRDGSLRCDTSEIFVG